MTTLPQTTAVRLPRPAGNGQIAPAGGIPMIHAGSAPAGGASMSGGDVWRVIRANAWLIAILLIVSGVAGYLCNSYEMTHHPKYTATGILQVEPTNRSDPTNLEQGGADIGIIGLEQKTQVAALKADGLFIKVLTNDASELRKTEWLAKVNANKLDPRDEFMDAFNVVGIPETRYLKVEFTSASPRDCKAIVQEMCDEHIKQEQTAVLELGRDQSLQLEKLRDVYQGQVNDFDARLASMQTNISDNGGEVSGKISMKEFTLQRLSEALAKADGQFHEINSIMNAAQENLKKGIDPPAVQQMVDTNGLLQQQKMTAHNWKAQYEASLEGQGENHPQTIKYKKAWEREQADADNQDAEARANARSSYVANVSSSLAEATKTRDLLKAQVEEASHDLASLSEKLVRYYATQKQREGAVQERDRVTNKLQLLQTGQQDKLAHKVSWASPPQMPTTPSFPKLRVILPIFLGVGLLLGLGIAFLREVTDTTVRSDRDIVRVGQMQLLGMVGDESQDPQAAGARLPLVIFDAPHSMTAEQLRQVRTRLQHAASLDTTRSLLVTSPSPGDGKTTIACNLAAGLALNGRRILLVDGNFRRPEIHKVFAVGNEQGFSNVLNGALTFDEAVHETQVPNLAVMTSGPKPINATEMFESQLLVDFIERALEEFDHVIFDSGPMMVVSESAAMAPRVDGVVTVCRARGNSRGLLTRMRDTLRALKAEHLGVVLNGVRAQGGGYYGRNIKAFYEYQNERA